MQNREQNQSPSSKANLQGNMAATSKSQTLEDGIKKEWNKLSDEDVGLYESQPDLFFSRIKDKHGVNRDQAQKRLDSIKQSYAADSDDDADTTDTDTDIDVDVDADADSDANTTVS